MCRLARMLKCLQRRLHTNQPQPYGTSCQQCVTICRHPGPVPLTERMKHSHNHTMPCMLMHEPHNADMQDGVLPLERAAAAGHSAACRVLIHAWIGDAVSTGVRRYRYRVLIWSCSHVNRNASGLSRRLTCILIMPNFTCLPSMIQTMPKLTLVVAV